MIIRVFFQPSANKSVISLSNENDGGRIAIFDHKENQIQSEFELPENCGRSICLSHDGKYFATAYWHREGIHIWSIQTGEVTQRIASSKVGGLRFDKSTEYIIFHSKSGSYARALSGEKTQRIKYCEGIDSASLSPSNHLYIPINRKGKYVDLEFDPFSSSIIDLHTPAKFHWIRHSPNNESYFLIDSHKSVYCYKTGTNKLNWHRSLKQIVQNDFMYAGTYSGNGELIGLTITELSGFRTIVLNAQHGEVVNEFPDQSCHGYPFGNFSVLLENGNVLNLESGETEPGLQAFFV
jgi:hypothetical protein